VSSQPGAYACGESASLLKGLGNDALGQMRRVNCDLLSYCLSVEVWGTVGTG